MNKTTQYRRTLLLDGLGAKATAKSLKRVRFSKGRPGGDHYDELWLQQLIMQHPGLLPIDEIEPTFTAMQPVCMELPVGSKSLDNLFITPQGDIALVECKLWRNPEARRDVIAQIIEYAQAMSSWTAEELENAVRRGKQFDAVASKDRPLMQMVATSDEVDSIAFYDAISRNLRRGRFLLLIVGDGIREGIEGMTAFLQQYAGFHFTLALVELAMFALDGERYVLQPRVLARTTNIDRGIVTIDAHGTIQIRPSTAPTARSTRTTITEERFFELIESQLPGVTSTDVPRGDHQPRSGG